MEVGSSYEGRCPECGRLLFARLYCPDLIPPPTVNVGCQQHKPTLLVTLNYVGVYAEVAG